MSSRTRSTVQALTRLPCLGRLGALAALVALGLLLAANGCLEGAQGDRCNPDLAAGESDCAAGLTCQQPVDCPESYCCPTTGPSTSPYCQPGCAGGQASICDAGGDADCDALLGPDGGG
jgi:uncharacterized membrane protein